MSRACAAGWRTATSRSRPGPAATEPTCRPARWTCIASAPRSRGRSRSPTPARRAAALSAALDLWQGPVLGETASDYLRERVGAAFEEIRLAATEQCAGAHLDDGQPDRAIVALAQAADRPVREHLVGLRMTALAAAAARPRRSRSTGRRAGLVADLGLEPGPDLRLLHDQILRSDDGQASHPGRPGKQPRQGRGSVPRELRRRRSAFSLAGPSSAGGSPRHWPARPVCRTGAGPRCCHTWNGRGREIGSRRAGRAPSRRAFP